MGETMTKAVHRASPYISVANLISLLALLAILAIPAVRLALGITARVGDQHASVVERVSTNTADIQNLKAENLRLEHEIQQLGVRNNDQYQQLNDKLDSLLRFLLKNRYDVVQP